MENQMVFERYEIKYLITRRQKDRVLRTMEPYMQADRYGRSTIRNVYFDTDTYRLIRASIEKPVYKEKLRVRSYGRVEAAEDVFVELKKKYRSVVYKRRVCMKDREAEQYLCSGGALPFHSQITEEIDYFRQYYGCLKPKVFLAYDREAFCGKDVADLRVTFDENILWRDTALSLRQEVYGVPLLPEGYVLMEIKTGGGIPLWMAHCLSREGIYKTSFSKYGNAYRQMALSAAEGGAVYA